MQRLARRATPSPRAARLDLAAGLLYPYAAEDSRSSARRRRAGLGPLALESDDLSPYDVRLGCPASDEPDSAQRFERPPLSG